METEMWHIADEVVVDMMGLLPIVTQLTLNSVKEIMEKYSSKTKEDETQGK